VAGRQKTRMDAEDQGQEIFSVQGKTRPLHRKKSGAPSGIAASVFVSATRPLYLARRERSHLPTVETLEKMARALEVPMYKLFYDGEAPPKLENLPKSV
jgi:hypothetical protein